VNELAVLLSAYLAVPTYAIRQRRRAADGCAIAAMAARDSWQPANVDIIVTCYNEQPGLLGECLASLREQDYRGRIKVWVVDDGSKNRAELLPVLADYAVPNWRILLSRENYGKRAAQALALKQGQGQVIVTVDSDTVLERDGIRRIVAPFRNRRVGAVTGSLRARNPGDSWLAEAIDTRYALMCMRERAAQSYFNSVLCCAGPFSAFRRTAVQQVLRRYLAPRRWTRHKRSGDDLELTNLVLEAGYHSVYQPAAKATTQVPTTILEFARQQRRWNRSLYRELPRMLRIVAKRRSYMVHDLMARALSPLLLAAGLLFTVADALRAQEELAFDGAALALMALASLPLGPSLLSRSGRRFVARYGLVFIGLLLAVRLWALCTVLRDTWGTRQLPTWTFPKPGEQARGVTDPDLVTLLPVEGDGTFKFALRFAPATAEA
jgi:N-acetylglucosaminyltransferase